LNVESKTSPSRRIYPPAWKTYGLEAEPEVNIVLERSFRSDTEYANTIINNYNRNQLE